MHYSWLFFGIGYGAVVSLGSITSNDGRSNAFSLREHECEGLAPRESLTPARRAIPFELISITSNLSEKMDSFSLELLHLHNVMMRTAASGRLGGSLQQATEACVRNIATKGTWYVVVSQTERYQSARDMQWACSAGETELAR